MMSKHQSLQNKAAQNKKVKAPTTRVLLIFLLFSFVAVAYWPVDTLTIRPALQTANQSAAAIFTAPALLGQAYTTKIIHSVQLTPVEDTYKLLQGKIWSWQGKFRSHNAGLPFSKPAQGRFRQDPPWMIIEGGRNSWQSIYYRVGTESLGKNEFIFPPFYQTKLWRTFSGQRLLFAIERQPLSQTIFLGL